MVKNLSAMWETWAPSLVQEDSLKKAVATHSSTFAWRILWTEECDGLQCMRSQRAGKDCSDLHAHMHAYSLEPVSMGLEHLELFWWPQLPLRDPPCSYQSSPFWSFTLALWHSGLFSAVAAWNTRTMNHLSCKSGRNEEDAEDFHVTKVVVEAAGPKGPNQCSAPPRHFFSSLLSFSHFCCLCPLLCTASFFLFICMAQNRAMWVNPTDLCLCA